MNNGRKLTKEEKEFFLEVYARNKDYRNHILSHNKKDKIEKFEFIFPCAMNGVDVSKIPEYIGYAVQVREKQGSFGSDVVLIRHINETISSHENQSFYRISVQKDIVKLLDKFKECLEYDNSHDLTFTIAGNAEETGFRIEAR